MTTTPAMPEPLGWYVVNNIGMATLCKDEAEAQLLAEDCDMVYQRQAPHRAVQLVALAALQAQPAEVSDDDISIAAAPFAWKNLNVTEHRTAFARAILALRPQAVPMLARSLSEWHEEDGPAMWWAWNGEERGWAGEPAYIGSPLSDDWPGYHTHWTPHPPQPSHHRITAPAGGEG